MCIDSSLFFWGEKYLLNILEARGSTEMFPFICLAQLLETVTAVILGFMYTMKNHRLSQVDVLGQKHLDLSVHETALWE